MCNPKAIPRQSQGNPKRGSRKKMETQMLPDVDPTVDISSDDILSEDILFADNFLEVENNFPPIVTTTAASVHHSAPSLSEAILETDIFLVSKFLFV
jgi:hypothetical protein